MITVKCGYRHCKFRIVCDYNPDLEIGGDNFIDAKSQMLDHYIVKHHVNTFTVEK